MRLRFGDKLEHARPCAACRGTGKATVPTTYSRSGQKIVGDGRVIPCPACRGTKMAISYAPFKV